MSRAQLEIRAVTDTPKTDAMIAKLEAELGERSPRISEAAIDVAVRLQLIALARQFERELAARPEGGRHEAFEEAAQKCRYYLKHQNFSQEQNDYDLGVTAACENLEKIMLEEAEKGKAVAPGRWYFIYESDSEDDVKHVRAKTALHCDLSVSGAVSAVMRFGMNSGPEKHG